MLVSDWSRRFIHSASWGCKVRFSQGVIIDPAVDAEAGATCGSKNGSAEEEKFGGDWRQTELATLSKQEPRRLGEGLSNEAQSE